MDEIEDTPTPPLVPEGEEEFSLEYVNTVLEDKVPNLKVLQCWSRFNLCFIQIVSGREARFDNDNLYILGRIRSVEKHAGNNGRNSLDVSVYVVYLFLH